MTDRATYLVTGGAGFIGSHICDRLVAEEHRVVVLDDLSSGTLDNVPAQADFHQLDLRSDQAAKLVEKIEPDAIFHLAAQMDVRRSTREPRFDADVNILGTLNLLEAAARSKVKKIVFASTGGAIYGEQESFPASEDHSCHPVSPYGVSKLACESYLYYFHSAYGLGVTCLRFANVYGARQNPLGEAGVVAIFLDKLFRGEPCVVTGDGLQTRDFIHVADVARANLAVLDSDGFETFNVGSGIETSVLELLSAVSAAVGVENRPVHAPERPGEQRRSSIDPSKLSRSTSWPSPVPLDQGLAETVAWYERSQGGSRE